MLVQLKALDVSDELVKSIKDELKMLKMTNLEDKVAAAMSEASLRQQIGLVVPTAPLKWSDKQQPAPSALESASSDLAAAKQLEQQTVWRMPPPRRMPRLVRRRRPGWRRQMQRRGKPPTWPSTMHSAALTTASAQLWNQSCATAERRD
jgi:hypothetical protein